MPTNRSSRTNELPTHEAIRISLKQAVARALDEDYDLIALGNHEQAIAHRIAVYLEQLFPTFHTDCEYNRKRHRPKTRRPDSREDVREMRPDIIVHRRNTSINVLAVEMKANANPATPNDLDKLTCLKAERTYRYTGIAFVCIRNALAEMADGVLSATIDWYDVRDGELLPEPSHRDNVACNIHSEQVIEIIEQRTQ